MQMHKDLAPGFQRFRMGDAARDHTVYSRRPPFAVCEDCANPTLSSIICGTSPHIHSYLDTISHSNRRSHEISK